MVLEVFLRQCGDLLRPLLNFCAVQPCDVAETFIAGCFGASWSFGVQSGEALKIRVYAFLWLSRLRRGRLEYHVEPLAGSFLGKQ